MTTGTDRQLERIADALEALVKIAQRAENPPEAADEKPIEWKPRWEDAQTVKPPEAEGVVLDVVAEKVVG